MLTMPFKSIKNKLSLTLLLGSLCLFLFVPKDQNPDFITPQEGSLLKTRAQQQQTHLIDSRQPGNLKLLHSRSRAIAFDSPHIENLIGQMRDAVIATHGLGLAAVQIGIPVRVVLMENTTAAETFFKAYINPEIIYKSFATQFVSEACLSLPDEGYHLYERSSRIKIRYQSETGQTVIETISGLNASIFQQEIDHINGILLTDHEYL